MNLMYLNQWLKYLGGGTHICNSYKYCYILIFDKNGMQNVKQATMPRITYDNGMNVNGDV